MSINEIKKGIAGLSVKDRAALAHWIITHLDAIDEGEVDQDWRQEVRSRVQAIKLGKVQMIPSEKMWQELLSVYEKTS